MMETEPASETFFLLIDEGKCPRICIGSIRIADIDPSYVYPDGDSMFLRNAGIYRRVYTAPQAQKNIIIVG
jgi:hypothetical protein